MDKPKTAKQINQEAGVGEIRIIDWFEEIVNIRINAYESGYREGKQAGIKEVVGWIKGQATDAPNGNLYLFLGKDWLLKLREWGIKKEV
jgi:hypothetical protein